MSQFIPLILFTVFTNFASQVLLKKGMTSIGEFELSASGLAGSLFHIVLNGYVIGGLVVMVISMGSHLVVLSRVDISYAYPFLGLSFVLTTAWGYFILSEDVNAWRVLGVALIFAGVSCVARS
jgi:multidrug transporter EmrE-like cation transporter